MFRCALVRATAMQARTHLRGLVMQQMQVRNVMIVLDGVTEDMLKKLPNKEYKKLTLDERHMRARMRLSNKQKLKKLNRQEKFAAMPVDEYEKLMNEKRTKAALSVTRMAQGRSSGYNVSIDLSLDAEVHKKHDRSSLLSQILHGYTYMRRAPIPFHLYLTAIHSSAELKDEIARRGMSNWQCTVDPRPAWELIKDINTDKAVLVHSSSNGRSINSNSEDMDVDNNIDGSIETAVAVSCSQQIDNIVLLSPDASEVLTSLDHNTLYVVPGIIDRSVTTGISLSLANKHGLIAKRLPIQEFLPKRQTHVLNIDTVMKIFCLYAEHKGDWKATLEAAVPKRKQQQRRMGHYAVVQTTPEIAPEIAPETSP